MVEVWNSALRNEIVHSLLAVNAIDLQQRVTRRVTMICTDPLIVNMYVRYINRPRDEQTPTATDCC